MEALRAKTPVFTDESGRRVTVLQWVARGLCACLFLVGAAIAITVVTHVALPGLGRLAPPTADSAGVAQESPADGGSALDAGLTAGSNPSSEGGNAVRLASRQEPTEVAGRDAAEGSTAEAAERPLGEVSARAAQAAAVPANGSGSTQTPKPPAPASPAPSTSPQSHSNASPRATAKSTNPTARATPPATANSQNPRATAAKFNGQSSDAPASTPPSWTK